MAKHSVLVADADPRHLRILEVALRKAGFSVGTATDGAEALRRIQRTPPDLLLADVLLPGNDGFALCAAVRADPKLAGLPVLLVSTDRAPAVKLRATELGADDFLVRPLLMKEVVARVRMLLEQREQLKLTQRGAPTGSMTGSVGDLGLVDLFQSIDNWKKSAIVLCEGAGGRVGRVWVRDGQVVDAETGPVQGEAAFYRLLNWDEGSFRVDFGAHDRDQHIEPGTQALLMEGMRRIDELTRYADRLPMRAALVVDTPSLLQRLGDLPDEVNGVLRLFEGRRTLEQVLEESPLDDLSTLAVVERLIGERVLLPVDAPRPGARPTLRDWLGGTSAPPPATPAAAAEQTAAIPAAAEPAPPAAAAEVPAAAAPMPAEVAVPREEAPVPRPDQDVPRAPAPVTAEAATPLQPTVAPAADPAGHTAQFALPLPAASAPPPEFEYDVTDKIRVPASLLLAEAARERAAKASAEKAEADKAAADLLAAEKAAGEKGEAQAAALHAAEAALEGQALLASAANNGAMPPAQPAQASVAVTAGAMPRLVVEPATPAAAADANASRELERVLFPPLRGVRRERLRREADEVRAAIAAGKPIRLVHALDLPAWGEQGASEAPTAHRRVSPAVSEEAKRLTMGEALFLHRRGAIPEGAAAAGANDNTSLSLASLEREPLPAEAPGAGDDENPTPTEVEPLTKAQVAAAEAAPAAAERHFIDDRSDAAIESMPLTMGALAEAQKASAEVVSTAVFAAPPPVESAPPEVAPPPPAAPAAVEPPPPAPAPMITDRIRVPIETSAVQAPLAPFEKTGADDPEPTTDKQGQDDLDAEIRAALGGGKRRWPIYAGAAALAAVAVWFFAVRQPPTDKKDSPWLDGEAKRPVATAAATPPADEPHDATPPAAASGVVTGVVKTPPPVEPSSPPVAPPPADVKPLAQAEQPPAEPPPPPAPAPVKKGADDYARAMTTGEGLLKRGKYKQAVGEFKRAVKANGSSVAALLSLGDAYLEADQPASALDPLRKAARLDPQNGRAQLLLGTAHQSLTHNKEAASAYQKYLELDPGGEFARDVRSILANLQR